jgi:hypothetical protein
VIVDIARLGEIMKEGPIQIDSNVGVGHGE